MTTVPPSPRSLAELATRLTALMAPMEDDAEAALSLEQRRIGWALFAVFDFLREQPEFADPLPLEPIKSLLRAIMDLENGSRSPLLVPKKSYGGGAPPMSNQQQHSMALAATGVDALIKFRHLSPDRAARRVALIMQRAGFNLPSRKNRSELLAKTISSFRNRLNTGEGGAPALALQTWQTYCQIRDRTEDMDVEGWLETIRKNVAASSVLNNPPINRN